MKQSSQFFNNSKGCKNSKGGVKYFISFKNIVNLEITGDYVEGSVYYAITNSNIILPSNTDNVKVKTNN